MQTKASPGFVAKLEGKHKALGDIRSIDKEAGVESNFIIEVLSSLIALMGMPVDIANIPRTTKLVHAFQ